MAGRNLVYELYERRLAAQIESGRVPGHVGVILDGNRRWARTRGFGTAQGHKRGADKIEEFLGWAEAAGVRVVTLWLLSTDNLARDPAELSSLLDIIAHAVGELASTGRWHLRLVGAVDLLPAPVAERLRAAAAPLHELALGGTAVGTGLNAPAGFDVEAARAISGLTGREFRPAPNKFHALTSRDELVFAHGAMKALACDMMKVANDVRWLASGPRLGLGEIRIPENEPGSSIMPGKVNPTQCEQVTMVVVQVMGNDAAVGVAASQGNFELNVFMPVCIYNFLQSARLLGDSIASFDERCAAGIAANRERMRANLHDSLMLVTALNPFIGYENAARTAQLAFREGLSLKEACVKLGFLTPQRFDEVFRPEAMA